MRREGSRIRKKADSMALPKSREEMRYHGWRMIGIKTCESRNCGAKLELWLNPITNRVSPMQSEGEFITHFAMCDAAPYFRRPRPAKRKPPANGNLFE